MTKLANMYRFIDALISHKICSCFHDNGATYASYWMDEDNNIVGMLLDRNGSGYMYHNLSLPEVVTWFNAIAENHEWFIEEQ